MKGIAQILFGCAMLLLGIFSAVMILGVSDWYLWVGLIIVAPFVGIFFAIIGLVNVCQKEKEEEEKKVYRPTQKQPETSENND